MTPLLPSHALDEGEATVVQHAGQEWIVMRRSGKVVGYRNRCPHRGVSLNPNDNPLLESTGKLLQCARHGALFQPDNGECVSGPCSGEFLEAIELIEQGSAIYAA